MKMTINEKITNCIVFVLTIVAILLSIVVIYMIILKLIGHSPDTLSIIMWIVPLLLSLQVVIIIILFQMKADIGRLEGRVGKLEGKLEEFRLNTINKLNEIDQRLGNLEAKIRS